LRLKEIERKIQVKKVNAERREPGLLHYHDSTTEAVDSTLTPGGGGIFINPTLASGYYRFEVRAIGKGIKEIRTGTLMEEISVGLL
jgi:hypothetical protein